VARTVQVSLEVDRGGQLSARALVPSLNQVFEQVAQLLVPEASPRCWSQPQVTDRSHGRAARQRLPPRPESHRWSACTSRSTSSASWSETSVPPKVAMPMPPKSPPVADRARRAHRGARGREALARAVRKAVRQVYRRQHAGDALGHRVREAAPHGRRDGGREGPASQRRKRATAAAATGTELATAAYYRNPEVWEDEFREALSHVERASDQARAQSLVQQGNQALAAGDNDKLRDIVEKLWKLLPASAEQRRQGYDSGVR
jgi:molecular chaperone DnaK